MGLFVRALVGIAVLSVSIVSTNAHQEHAEATSSGGLLYYTPAARHTVTFNERSFVIDGTPTLLLSGAVR